MPSPLDEVLAALQALLDARAEAPIPERAGEGNFRCEGCEDCSHCRFCIDCTACDDCTYCEACEGCVSCTHCKHCERSENLTHSQWSAECAKSSYLTLCLDCEECVQCFACVGLQGEEFCVLNEKLPRKAYFNRVAELRGALEERIGAGWRPPWMVEEEPEPEPVPVPVPERVVKAEAVPEPMTRLPSPSPSPAPLRSPEPELPQSATATSSLESRSRTGTPPWSFADVRRDRGSSAFVDEPPPTRSELVPQPPPFGSSPSVERGSSRYDDGLDDLDHGLDPLAEAARDRFGWSAQAEGTPVRLDWPPRDENARAGLDAPYERRARDEAPRPDIGPPFERRVRDEARPEPGTPNDRGSRKRETRDQLSALEPEAPQKRRRGVYDDWSRLDPELERRDPHADDLDRRRRETAASPGAEPDDPLPLPRPSDSRADLRGPAFDAWSPYDELHRAKIGPEEQTEPDAPVARRGRDKAEISGAASEPVPAADAEDAPTPEAPPREPDVPRAPTPPDARSTPTVAHAEAREATSDFDAPAPDAPVRSALLRGRAPARPTPAAARQPDAPSIRRARRPARGASRDDTPTAPHPAGTSEAPDREPVP